MTKDAYYKIGIFILALCIITWMFLPNSWGAESKEIRSRDNLAGRLVDRDGTVSSTTAHSQLHQPERLM